MIGYETSPAAPAGWYPDPTAPGATRWWDGSAWTEHARPMPYVAPVPTLPSAAQPAWAVQSNAPSGHTVGVWLLAFVPVMIWIATFIGGIVAVLAGLPSSYGLVALLPVIVAEWVFAYLDSRSLAARGVRRPAIAWMLLLPPLCYLIARGRAVRAAGAKGWQPEAVFFSQWALGFVLNIAITGLLANP